MNISELRITKLHGYLNIKLPINDNKIIIVGVNGIGKSSVLNCLYYIISRQWFRLLDYTFSEMTLVVDGNDISFTREHLEEAKLEESRRRFALPSRMMASIDRLRGSAEYEEFTASKITQPRIKKLAKLLEVPEHLVIRLRKEYMLSAGGESGSATNLFLKHDELLRTTITSRILYLPTYRRIERELQHILPKLSEHLRRQLEEESVGVSRGSDIFLEFVEFGMEDVRKKFDETTTVVERSARTSLNNLAAGYLRDVIRGEGAQFDIDEIRSLDDNTITNILGRVEEAVLDEHDKSRLRDVITDVASNSTVTNDAKYIVHYFSQLHSVVKSLQNKEAAIKTFVQVCNSYLYGKSLSYNDRDYALTIRDDSSRVLDLRLLSSGEKQIVSLLSHLFLSQDQRFSVIIDEPELSLSVDWQAKFLPDALSSGKCDFLAAVTHSPFIFDNDLRKYAIDLRTVTKAK